MFPAWARPSSPVRLARSIACKFSRVQLTPDLLPSDVLGVSVFNNETRNFDFKPGPIFANIVLADEINRTTPRTQSALLEAMAEETISIENQTYPLERPFMVVATQNPFEFEGTYYLPENQLDRFLLRINVGYPDRASEHRILSLQPGRGAPGRPQARDHRRPDRGASGSRAQDPHRQYAARLHPRHRRGDGAITISFHLGISPRGSLALTAACQASAILSGRDYVIPDDVKQLVIPVCAHRVISKSYLHNGDGDSTARILKTILDQIPTPR